MVQRDWTFRESLLAIQDWEDILALWEEETPEDARTPILPVPTNGVAVDWPNPIPSSLLCEDSPPAPMRLKVVEDQICLIRGENASPASPDEALRGYEHPGGGAKDQWYHGYQRRFDGLTEFRPKKAPFVLSVDAPLDLTMGHNRLAIQIANASLARLAVSVRARRLSLSPDRSTGEAATTPPKLIETSLGEHILDLSPEERGSVIFPVDLIQPGGGLVLVAHSGCRRGLLAALLDPR